MQTLELNKMGLEPMTETERREVGGGANSPSPSSGGVLNPDNFKTDQPTIAGEIFLNNGY